MDFARHESRYISTVLDHVGYTYEMVRHRQEMYSECDKLLNRNEVLGYTRVTTGGKGEGTTLFLESDIDFMYVVKNVVCADNVDLFRGNHDHTLFQMERDDSSPGYTKLKLLKFGDNLYSEEMEMSLTKIENGPGYLSSALFTKTINVAHKQARAETNFQECAPAGPSNPVTDGYRSSDMVMSFPCVCPDIIDRWVNRPRPHGWPPQETIEEIARLDGHVVPVGFKGSATQDLEWRICYTLAELQLMKVLNETQIKVYILLKQIAKAVLQKVCKDITSYIVKNIVLWTCERTDASDFSEIDLLDRLNDGISYLKKCLDENNLPSYMIPERNLLAGKLSNDQRERLAILCDDLLNEGIHMLQRIDKIRHAMALMDKSPEQLRETSEKRDKLESLQLLRLKFEAETLKVGLSLEETRHLLSQNEVLMDIQRNVLMLLQLDETQLMGMSSREIEELVKNKLLILLS